jgi:hypothetical protein
MADAVPELLSPPDELERSVWVVVDVRDFVTKQRVQALDVRLKDVAARPIAALSGVYCFTDLDLSTGNYTAQVRLRAEARARYFDAERQFALVTVPVPGQPLNRNPVPIELLPRPAYPFSAEATLARGRLVKTSNRDPIAGARVFLILEAVDLGRAANTDERGEFVVFLPPAAPEDTETAVLKNFNFQLRFEIDGQPALLIPPAVVKERSTLSLKEIPFPGI